MVIDERRRRKPDPLPLDEMQRSWQPGPEQRALATDRSRVLREQLNRLPPDQAHIVELRLAGLTDQEIARVLGRSPGAIRVSQHRAVNRLRALFSEMDGLDEGLRHGDE